MIICHDLRERSATELPSTLERLWKESPQTLLTVSHRPHKKWTATLSFAQPLVFSSSALYELIFWVPKNFDLNLPSEIASEQQRLLDEYRTIFELEEVALRKKALSRYKDLVLRHITRDESEFYPALLERLPVERALRELSYEHRGLEKGLNELATSLDHAQGDTVTNKERERLDLNFYHLLEHHLERERDALYPAWKILAEKG